MIWKYFLQEIFESTFIEVIFLKKQNLIIGSIYRHPISIISIEMFNKDWLIELLWKKKPVP